MRITQLTARLLRLPLAHAVALLDGREPIQHVDLLVVHLETDSRLVGLGFVPTRGGGRALLALTQDDIAPLVVGEDPLDNQRLTSRFVRRSVSLGRGLAARAYAAVDLALWDLKGKAAGLPLYRLLGGARNSAPVFAADTGWPGMNGNEIVNAARPYLDQGFRGIVIGIGNPDPEVDARRLEHFRDTFGEEVWLGVDGRQSYDYGTALAMGHFLAENVAPDWFEEPVAADDIETHARLAEQLGLPLAVGASLDGAGQFRDYLQARAADVLRPDLARLGGLTSWLKVAALAEVHHRPVAACVPPQIGVHLACGVENAMAVEWLPWLSAVLPLPEVRNGQVVPPSAPGLGLEIDPANLARYAT